MDPKQNESDREADQFELRFHQQQVSRQSKAGWGFVIAAGLALWWGTDHLRKLEIALETANYGVLLVQLVVPVSLFSIGVAFFIRASKHSRKADKAVRVVAGGFNAEDHPSCPQCGSRPGGWKYVREAPNQPLVKRLSCGDCNKVY
jgi:hypothetical protein